MAFIADIFLLAGALGAGIYCHVLSKRLRQFTNLEKGVGGAVAVLSAQVDDLTQTLTNSQKTAKQSVETLCGVSERAEAAARHLELLVASLHDLPSDQSASPSYSNNSGTAPPHHNKNNPFNAHFSQTLSRRQ